MKLLNSKDASLRKILEANGIDVAELVEKTAGVVKVLHSQSTAIHNEASARIALIMQSSQ